MRPTLIERLKDSYSFLGDPLHREAYETLELLQAALEDLTYTYHSPEDYQERAKEALKEYQNDREQRT
jgi:predicted RNA-binding protein with EMAP domain